ncbi:dihydroorotate dehydrogenase (quinone), mitochondrial-like isoform X2 [Mytilus californianus]|uniref:dihydroorotate dehydrogenase (quinone), mitochondrial-like isoform X2 n=1 Tax=Mytilus californianus TaxID=6549 RepID=UPI002246E7DA|nr:dihydroorotate dehydrogenase (quinone), mitochondrial-like isoform X2 [Mytilus californianus]
MSGAAKKGPGNLKLLKDAFIITTGGTVMFAGHQIYKGNEKFYKEYVMPFFQLFDAETSHKMAVKAAKYKLVPKSKIPPHPVLASRVFDRDFPSPVGLAAGFDKDGEAVDGMLKMGFSFVEVGSVTPYPQPGNEKPRVFRLKEDKAVINRYGFNSEGHDKVYNRLKVREVEPPVVVPGIMGVNLGKNKTSSYPVEDYVQGVKKFGKVADYLVINISSPNTPGLRAMQGKDMLDTLLEKVLSERDHIRGRKPPLLVKIAPDLTDQDKIDIAEVILNRKESLGGLIISNTTVSRPDSLKSPHKDEVGGLSGGPLKDLSTKTISDMYKLTEGKVPIIGVGGISSGEDAYDKIKEGASLVQLYTALIYQGPPVIGKINRELSELLIKDGYRSITEAVGANHKTKS